MNELRWQLHDLWPDWELPARALAQPGWQTKIASRLARAQQTTQVLIARDTIRRIRELSRATKDLYNKIAALIRKVAPQLLAEPGIGVLLAAKFIGRSPGSSALARRPARPPRQAAPQSQSPADEQTATDSIPAATDGSTAPSTCSRSSASLTTPAPPSTSKNNARTARPKRSDPQPQTPSRPPRLPPPTRPRQRLTQHLLDIEDSRRRDEPAGTRYQMREKLFAIGDDFWVETEGGQQALRSTARRYGFAAHSSSRPVGGRAVQVQEKKPRVRDTMTIERNGDTVATVKTASITPLRDRFSTDLKDGGKLSAKGNIVDHEYKIERDGHKIAEISKRWFRIRDTYGIKIVPGENDALILAATVCIDEMARDSRAAVPDRTPADSRDPTRLPFRRPSGHEIAAAASVLWRREQHSAGAG